MAITEKPGQNIIEVTDISDAEVISHIEPGLCQTSKE